MNLHKVNTKMLITIKTYVFIYMCVFFILSFFSDFKFII